MSTNKTIDNEIDFPVGPNQVDANEIYGHLESIGVGFSMRVLAISFGTEGELIMDGVTEEDISIKPYVKEYKDLAEIVKNKEILYNRLTEKELYVTEDLFKSSFDAMLEYDPESKSYAFSIYSDFYEVFNKLKETICV